MIQIEVVGEEVLLQLKGLPRKIQNAVKSKLDQVLTGIEENVLESLPGKYLDPKQMVTGIVKQGSLTIGFLEYTDKGGWYPIVPVKARLLRFIGKQDGQVVFTSYVRHPYLKGTPVLTQKMIELKPWIQDQLESAMNNVL